MKSTLARHPKATSLSCGAIFGVLLLTVGLRGNPIDAVAVVLAVLLGACFAGAMYMAYRVASPPN